MADRYVVTAPIRHGYAWWNIADTKSQIMENFAVATFAESMPGAEKEARALCERLNGRTK